ncbi:hypothetical protein Tco_1058278 [Tanacetum coccineum]|uniref:Uncharacterized protein n=1 Tax=Tanacetum coccineum TaxID=301880 RepID=A0ABQ5H8Q2_9ASTR
MSWKSTPNGSIVSASEDGTLAHKPMSILERRLGKLNNKLVMFHEFDKEEGDDFGVDVLRFHTCLTDILGFLEKFGWWFEQDIGGESEDDREKRLMMVQEVVWLNREVPA